MLERLPGGVSPIQTKASRPGDHESPWWWLGRTGIERYMGDCYMSRMKSTVPRLPGVRGSDAAKHWLLGRAVRLSPGETVGVGLQGGQRPKNCKDSKLG